MPERRKIVLDTNCLVASLSRHSQYYPVWKGLQTDQYVLCLTNDILEEYEEIIGHKTSAEVARNVVSLLLKSKNVEFVDAYFKWRLIEADHDDDKFVDCAFAANATYIVSDDKHFDILEKISFPKISVLKLQEFLRILVD
ncbi:MAG: putative toxin-antitoxin system toxin component, PIN family [Bacteroidales bacterium]|nr:putative toxin-antitoxin system toxin component, PIN family [Bacteroidales bacterium]